MSFDPDDDLERVIRPFYDISKKGFLEGAVTKLTYNTHTNREQYILDKAVRRLRMRQELMKEHVQTAQARTDAMKGLLNVKRNELQLQAEYRAMLEGGVEVPQLQAPPPRTLPPQASHAPMSVKISEAQIQQDVVTISLGMSNLTGDDAICDFLIEHEDRLMDSGYSPELAKSTIKKAVKVAAKR